MSIHFFLILRSKRAQAKLGDRFGRVVFLYALLPTIYQQSKNLQLK